MLKLRDLRSEHQTARVGAELSPSPSSTLKLEFSAEWNSAFLSVFLPSVLIVTLVFFAQWKRRKVQVILVSLAAIMSILVLVSVFVSYAIGWQLIDWILLSIPYNITITSLQNQKREERLIEPLD
ncbi:hypothetical protein ANCCAN_28172 [Ancylostoma caninum]|uniref:Uncharacterized protein n=1 Tax=Ancylostoma caninum TaxID=29170 RepID=A0A368F530_ANCCA|nr:hypothetical protein ANCCAN_28172 [Ancylostoma caninum]